MSSRSTADRRSPRPLRRPGLIAHVLAVACLVLGGVATTQAAAPGISVCIDRANPFRDIDRTLIDAIGRLHSPQPRIVSIDTRDGSAGLNARRPNFFVDLTKRCNLVMGFPVESGHPFLPKGLKATAPYARTGFVIAGYKRPPAFKDLAPLTRVGTVYLTVPTTYFGKPPGAGLQEHEYSTPASLLAALERHEISYALMWQPWLDHALATHPAPILQRRLDTPHADWSIVALYAPNAAGRRAARRFNKGIVRLAQDRRLARIVNPYQTP